MPRGITPEQALKISIDKGCQMTKLKTLRTLKGYSQEELAEACGIKKRLLQSYETLESNINNASLYNLCSICEVLCCSLSDILEDEELIQRLRKLY